MDQIPLNDAVIVPELGVTNPACLYVTWSLDVLSRTAETVWWFGPGRERNAVASGHSTSDLATGWQFGEAAWLVRKLKEVEGRIEPF